MTLQERLAQMVNVAAENGNMSSEELAWAARENARLEKAAAEKED